MMKTLTDEQWRAITEQISLSRKLYQLCSLILYHLGQYENTQRFDDSLMKIVEEMSDFSFESSISE